MKKILGLFFSALSALFLYAHFVDNKSILLNQIIGYIFPVLLYGISAVFFFCFDRVYKKDYIDGFITRDTQCLIAVILFIFYAIVSLVAISVSGVTNGALSGSDTGILSVVFSLVVPYVIPMLIFAIILDIYYLPYRLSKKLFLYSDSAIEYYLSDDAEYTSYSEDGFVLANKDAIFLPKLYCIIPISTIKSVKSSLPWLVSVKLHSGKKLTLYTSHCKNIVKAVRENKIYNTGTNSK